MPNTTIKYFDGINDAIEKLAITGAMHSVKENISKFNMAPMFVRLLTKG
jgi:hypothetical protein